MHAVYPTLDELAAHLGKEVQPFVLLMEPGEGPGLLRRWEPVEIDPELDAAFPAQRAARVEIETRDGRSHALLQPTRKGDPDAPLSDAELEAKYLELAGPVLGETRARDLLEQLWTLERAPAGALLRLTDAAL